MELLSQFFVAIYKPYIIIWHISDCLVVNFFEKLMLHESAQVPADCLLLDFLYNFLRFDKKYAFKISDIYVSELQLTC